MLLSSLWINNSNTIHPERWQLGDEVKLILFLLSRKIPVTWSNTKYDDNSYSREWIIYLKLSRWNFFYPADFKVVLKLWIYILRIRSFHYVKKQTLSKPLSTWMNIPSEWMICLWILLTSTCCNSCLNRADLWLHHRESLSILITLCRHHWASSVSIWQYNF